MATGLAALPDDALSGVLRALPPKSLAVARCVCKAWRDVVDGRALLRPHLLPHSVRGIFINYIDHYRPHLFTRPVSPSTVPNVDGTLSFLPNAGRFDRWSAVDHCNGLLLCAVDLESQLCVCNPATRRWTVLPPAAKPTRRWWTVDARWWTVDADGKYAGAYIAFDPAASPHYEVVLIPAVPEKPTSTPSVDDEVLERELMSLDGMATALISNNTWTLVPRPPRANIVSGKWIFKHKFHADGSLDRYKARWVLRGFTQRPGVDFDETFSPPSALFRAWPSPWTGPFISWTSTTLSSMAPSPKQSIALNPLVLWIRNAPITCAALISPSTDSSRRPVPGTAALPPTSKKMGFIEAKTDTSFAHRFVSGISSSAHCFPAQSFPMKDLGPLQHFLGIAVTRSSSGMLLSQRRYTLEILERAAALLCLLLIRLSSALQYLTFTRPDITYAVQQVCLHMHDPREPHLTAVKRILRYLRTLGCLLSARPCPPPSPSTPMPTRLVAQTLAVLLLVTRKRQPTVSRSSAEAEYRAVANGVAEASWLRQLLQELGHPLQRATLVYCDNVSAVYLSTNPVQHQRTKHIEIDLHFVRERVAAGAVRVLHPPSPWMLRVFSSATGRWEERALVREGMPAGTVEEMQSDPKKLSCGPRNRSAVYHRGSLYVHCRGSFVARLSLLKGTFQIIEAPSNIKHTKPYLGKLWNRVCFGIVHDEQLKIWILNESCGKIEWFLKYETDVGNYAKHLPSIAYHNSGRTYGSWNVEEEDIDTQDSDDDAHVENLSEKSSYEWDSDDDDTFTVNSDIQNYYDGNGLDIMGFHPYKEVVFLTKWFRVVAYHLNSTKIQHLGNSCPNCYCYNHSNGIYESFIYTPCMIQDMLHGDQTGQS
ncbi:LOW QUALITY PROTEIN: hypothetical protein U9M48_030629, partial [Paspalum notatum var. saurae]